MKLPSGHRALSEMFLNAETPIIDELRGGYLVDMLTVWPSFRRFSHRKIIYRKDNRVLGHNVLFNKPWGHFFIEEGICENPGRLKVALINYNREENPLPLRGIRDQLRRVKKDELYIGRFNYIFSGRPFFLGYFSLEKTS